MTTERNKPWYHAAPGEKPTMALKSTISISSDRMQPPSFSNGFSRLLHPPIRPVRIVHPAAAELPTAPPPPPHGPRCPRAPTPAPRARPQRCDGRGTWRSGAGTRSSRCGERDQRCPEIFDMAGLTVFGLAFEHVSTHKMRGEMDLIAGDDI